MTNPVHGGRRSQDIAFTVTASTAYPNAMKTGFLFRSGWDKTTRIFNPSTVVPYEIPWQTWVRMDLLDVSGRVLKVLVDSEVKAGRHWVLVDASGLPSGVYVVRLRADVGVELSKITISK